MKPKIVFLAFLLFVPSIPPTAQAQGDRSQELFRDEVLPVLMRLAEPALSPPLPGKALLLEVSARYEKTRGTLLLAWDAAGQHAVRINIPGYGASRAAFTSTGSWLFLPDSNVLFISKPENAFSGSPLAECRLWKTAKKRFAEAVMAAQFSSALLKVPIEKTGADCFTAQSENGDWRITLKGRRDAGPIALNVFKPVSAEISFKHIGPVDSGEFSELLKRPPSPKRLEVVDTGGLRSMFATVTDMLCEKALWKVLPGAVPTLFPGLKRVDGRIVVILRGTPEEIGRRYGELVKTAIVCNTRRILYGIGCIETIRSGEWFPETMRKVWEKQKKYVPGRFRREMDAMAAAAGVPREHAYHTNLFPELFHCSGLALRGRATAGGTLMHGRILDYMTEVGLQATSLITVIVPEEGHAWINVGYAGCIGTVTAMNERGLAMGEMGGRGEGHLDGMPMTFLMREIMERFETTEEALDWMQGVPRTCEYFYVLSDAKTGSMAGVASYAKTLAAERGTADLEIVRPGETHRLLPHAIPDAVLMSAGGRYERLAGRVKDNYGRITPGVAWDIMGEGVAMTSALHIALFMPQTLDLWVAEASLDAKPAYTQPVAKLNLRELLAKPPKPAKGSTLETPSKPIIVK